MKISVVVKSISYDNQTHTRLPQTGVLWVPSSKLQRLVDAPAALASETFHFRLCDQWCIP